MRVLKLFLLCLFLVGCGSSGGGSSNSGGGGSDPQPQVVQGQWTIHATSTENNGTFIELFDLSNQGGGSFYSVAAIQCQLQYRTCAGDLVGGGSLSLQGTVNSSGGVSISLTVTQGSDAIFPGGGTTCTVTATGQLSGSTIVSGSYNGCNDAGTWTGSQTTTSASGAYMGSLSSQETPGNSPVKFSASITEGSNYQLTGQASLTGSQCFTTLNFGPPSVAIGEAIFLEDSANQVYAVALPTESGTNVWYNVTNPSCPDYGYGTFTFTPAN